MTPPKESPDDGLLSRGRAIIKSPDWQPGTVAEHRVRDWIEEAIAALSAAEAENAKLREELTVIAGMRYWHKPPPVKFISRLASSLLYAKEGP